MSKIDAKLLKAACVAYDNNSCGEESADDTGMWAAIEAYEAAKANDQPVGLSYEVPFRRADHVEAMSDIIRRCNKTMEKTVGLPWVTLDQIKKIASRQLLLMKTPMQDE